MTNERCLFCRIIAGEIPAKFVFDDDDVLAFEDINPQAPTHILLIPRRHIASLNDLTDADTETIGKVLVRAANLAREYHLHSDGYRVVINHGAAAGQSVFHIHAHLLGGRRLTWPPG
jgi:histidine triad (HIT) family protein